MRVYFIVALGAVLCLAACGTPGAPRPPSLELPKPVTDLSATRVGDKVTLRWTAPNETTDGSNIRHPGATRICRDLVQHSSESCTVVAELPAVAAAANNRNPVTRTYVDQLPAALQTEHPTSFVQYAVVAVNDRGKSAGVSNYLQVPLAPTARPPDKVTAEVGPDKVVVEASGVEPLLSRSSHPKDLSVSLHLFRHEPGGPTIDVGSGTWRVGSGPGGYRTQFLDRNFEWEKKYLYYFAGVTTVSLPGKQPVEVIGESSTEITVFTKDIFPPAAPTGLQAVGSGVGQAPFIDLSWVANTEADLADYNVYRNEEGQAAVKINNELVKAPASRDSNVTSGHKYLYAVTAVDLRGNESSHSAEASESVP